MRELPQHSMAHRIASFSDIPPRGESRRVSRGGRESARNYLILLVVAILLSCQGVSAAQGWAATDSGKYAGEFFGIKVPMDNYYIIRNALILFGNKWGAQPRTKEEFENTLWDNLLLSFVAFNENITVTQGEVDAEIDKSLKAEQATFDRNTDRAAYEKWVKEKANEPPELFANQIKHFLQLDKLRRQIMDKANPEVTDEEAHTRYLCEGSSLSLEMRQFDTRKEADEFFRKVNGNPGAWEKEKQRKPKEFKRPGFVTVMFLIDIWRIPEEAALKMLQREAGDNYPPRPIYKGFAVFNILEKRAAEEKGFADVRQAFIDKIKLIKKNEAVGKWFEALKKQANIKIYDQKGGGQ